MAPLPTEAVDKFKGKKGKKIEGILASEAQRRSHTLTNVSASFNLHCHLPPYNTYIKELNYKFFARLKRLYGIMFPLHQRNELCFKISSNNSHQSDKIPQDLILDYPELLYACTDVINDSNNNVGPKSLRRKSISSDNNNDDSTTLGNDSKRKLIHRDIERQRRQEMATLYASLRSLLPLEYIKGKRSTSDHISESVNYIKYLRKRLKELDEKKDELKKKISLRDIPLQNSSGSSSTSSQNAGILIRPCLSGIEVVFSTGLSEQDRGSTLSRVLQVLLNAEISVVNCVSTKVNERIFHTVQTEVTDRTCLNLSELHQKLTQS